MRRRHDNAAADTNHGNAIDQVSGSPVGVDRRRAADAQEAASDFDGHRHLIRVVQDTDQVGWGWLGLVGFFHVRRMP